MWGPPGFPDRPPASLGSSAAMAAVHLLAPAPASFDSSLLLSLRSSPQEFHLPAPAQRKLPSATHTRTSSKSDSRIVHHRHSPNSQHQTATTMPVPKSEYLSPVWKDGIFGESPARPIPSHDPLPRKAARVLTLPQSWQSRLCDRRRRLNLLGADARPCCPGRQCRHHRPQRREDGARRCRHCHG